jgi:hypothetical protein
MALITALSLSATATAATCNWIGGSGDWHTPAKWSCGRVPTDMDDVTLNLSSFGTTVTVNAPAPAKTLTLISNGATLSGTGAVLVSGLTTINAVTTTTISTSGSRLPALTVSVASGGYIFTLTDPALTADSLDSVNVSGVLGGGSAMVLDVGAHNIGTFTLQNGAINLRAPITVTTQMDWNQGSVSSNTQQSLTFGPAATGTVNGGNFSTALINRGTLTANGINGLIANSAASFTNHGTLDVRIASQTAENNFATGQSFGGSSMSFVNYGSVLFNHSGTLAFDAQSEFSNHGTVRFNSGTVYFRLNQYRQYAGLTRFAGGNASGSAKCCSLDNSQLVLLGGVLSGGDNPLFDVVGGIDNDGGTVLLDGNLKVTNYYQQTAKGSLAVTINGTNAGTDFGTLSVLRRAGVTSNGSITLAGNLIVDRGPAFTPRSGDRFTIMTGEGNVTGNTSGGSGSMYPAFAAFAGAGQVVVAEPAQALLVQARADQPTSLRGGSNGYTIQLVNPTTAAISVSTIQVTTPIEFAYQTGSTTGITTANPLSGDNPGAGTRDLIWFLPAPVSIPSGGSRTLHFGISIGAQARLELLRASGGISGPGLSVTFSGVAPVDVKVSSALSGTTISVTGGGNIQPQNGTDNILVARSSLAQSFINVRSRITCPVEYRPCGNLRTVFVGQWYGGRFYNVRQLTLDPDQSEPMAAPPAKGTAARTTVMRAGGSLTGKSQAGDDYGFWTGQIPGSGVLPGVPQKLFPDWDNKRPCIAFNGDGNGLYPVGCVGGDGGGGDGVGTPQLYDPSGIISDATTGLPIVGATVSLYRQIPGLPDTATLTRQCRTIDTRGGPVWTGTAPDTGVFEQPGFMPAQMSPDVNPQITGVDGRYGWNVVTGCWYVKVSAPGYASKISALVGVPPEVTDLHIALQPVVAGAVNLTGVVSSKTHGTAGTFGLPIDTAAAISGAVTVESRIIGAGHTLVFQFDGAITAAGNVATVDAASNPVGTATATASGNDVIVTLVNIPDNQRVRVMLSGVNNLSNAEAAVGFLVGDINNSRSVNATDISGVKARSGQTTDAGNFRFDLNTSGGINATDISAVKARSGLVLP